MLTIFCTISSTTYHSIADGKTEADNMIAGHLKKLRNYYSIMPHIVVHDTCLNALQIQLR